MEKNVRTSINEAGVKRMNGSLIRGEKNAKVGGEKREKIDSWFEGEGLYMHRDAICPRHLPCQSSDQARHIAALPANERFVPSRILIACEP